MSLLGQVKAAPSGYSPRLHFSQNSLNHFAPGPLAAGLADDPAPAAAVDAVLHGFQGRANVQIETAVRQVGRLVQDAAVPGRSLKAGGGVHAQHPQFAPPFGADPQFAVADIGAMLAADDPLVGNQLEQVAPGHPLRLVPRRHPVEVTRVRPRPAFSQMGDQKPFCEVRLAAAAAGIEADEPRSAGQRLLLLSVPEQGPPARSRAVPPLLLKQLRIENVNSSAECYHCS